MKRRIFLKNATLACAANSLMPLELTATKFPIKEEGILVKPSKAQREWMDMKFGMFVHFGINTFYDKEWSDGTLDPAGYNPSSIDTDQWCRVAKAAGMKYIVITTKHHDGFALWPSKYTDYSVTASPVKTDVLDKIADSAQKYGLKLGFYFSLWDRHDPAYKNDWFAFIEKMKGQIRELLTNYGQVTELWLDGFWKKQKHGWTKRKTNIEGEAGFQKKHLQRDLGFIQAWRSEGAYCWQIDAIYQLVKELQPSCLLMNNSTTAYPGVPLHPVDIRSGEKYTKAKKDKKVWEWLGTKKYFPLQIETTMSTKGNEKFPSGNWFWHASDQSVVSLETIKNYRNVAQSMEANLLLNVGITDKGKLRQIDENVLLKLGS
jgi:alpha-L-fucosidase